MSSLNKSILTKAISWTEQEKDKIHSLPGSIIKYIEKTDNLREPQVEAVKVYLWLKFVGNNQKLSEIIKQGLIYDDQVAREYDNYHTFGENFVTQFINQFAQENNLKKLHKKLVNDPHGDKYDWNKFLDELLHNYPYPSYLFSLPMGTGKTFLMAMYVYLDLYFSKLLKDDKRFAKNFVVFAPQATKTAILPSLQTIKNFDPNWIFPRDEAERLRQEINIEVLDALSSKRKDKLQGNNPNLEKVNRLVQSKGKGDVSKTSGLVFITNAEKVVLERYDDKDFVIANMGDEKQKAELQKTNDLREKLSQIPQLLVILDEVHHVYGSNKNGEKKLRQAVGVLNQHKNVVSVIGMSGTPFVKNNVKIGEDEIKLNQIQDIVYDYPLNKGVGRFLKIPDIRRRDVRQSIFIKEALDEFFKDYDLNYYNGTKSKIVFYCPSVEKLNREILPAVQEWYQEKRKNKDHEIFRYYSKVSKENKEYELPKENLAIFNNLDKPYSDKRVVLLVAVGTEGWDCKSLTAVALPRKETSKNFVLQTTCRCLREVENAQNEHALIFLGDGNYEILNSQLEETYRLKISDLKDVVSEELPVLIRKPKLGKLKYKQIETKYELVQRIEAKPEEILDRFDLKRIKEKYKFDPRSAKAKIGEAGLTQEIIYNKKLTYKPKEYTYEDFIYDIARNTWGKFTESDLVSKHNKHLVKIYETLQKDKDWIVANPLLPQDFSDITKELSSNLMQEATYKIETIESDVEIKLLEWTVTNPTMSLFNSSGVLFKFSPQISTKSEAELYRRHPEDLEKDFFSKEDNKTNIDPQDVSYNYIPYKMDSEFERKALESIVKISDMEGLEVYFSGYKDSRLETFWVQTPDGVYTPDFLVLSREKGEIKKVLIVETKGKPHYDAEFQRKEKFMKEVFVKHNPNFAYECFVDEGGNNFELHMEKFTELIKSLKN
ncbi:hypothetical protein A2692_05655 [Candidatus Woesebacteria bacterium RIFCSPHIGHO2_01_FULL_39_95]|nr:MAG: hypothetical protein A2692_05655 [Candidatus Woesebacteria bacterium RIFCSPHIGHO2_01_FULL_39_95]